MLYVRQNKPDHHFFFKNGSEGHPVATFVSEYGTRMHVHIDDHCYVLCHDAGSEKVGDKKPCRSTQWWPSEVWEHTRDLPAPRALEKVSTPLDPTEKTPRFFPNVNGSHSGCDILHSQRNYKQGDHVATLEIWKGTVGRTPAFVKVLKGHGVIEPSRNFHYSAEEAQQNAHLYLTSHDGFPAYEPTGPWE